MACKQSALAGRYLEGKLRPETAEKFEEHYIGCKECVEQLKFLETVSAGIKKAVKDGDLKLEL